MTKNWDSKMFLIFFLQSYFFSNNLGHRFDMITWLDSIIFLGCFLILIFFLVLSFNILFIDIFFLFLDELKLYFRYYFIKFYLIFTLLSWLYELFTNINNKSFQIMGMPLFFVHVIMINFFLVQLIYVLVDCFVFII